MRTVLKLFLALPHFADGFRVASRVHKTPDSAWLNGLSCNGYALQDLPYLASGFQGDVFLGEDWVVKVAKGRGADVEEKFQRECKVLRMLRSVDHVIRCLGECVFNSRPILILSRARGISFKKSSIQGTTEFQTRAVTLTLQVGLEILNQGIVNTDQQPNILFDTRGTPTFIDFGAAVELNTKDKGFRDFYVDTYLRELFFLVPTSMVSLADRILGNATGPDTHRIVEVWAESRAKKLAATPSPTAYFSSWAASNAESLSKHDVKIPDLVRYVVMCSQKICLGLSNAVVECATSLPHDMTFIRCCAGTARGRHVVRKMALGIECSDDANTSAQLKSVGFTSWEDTTHIHSAKALGMVRRVRRIHNDLMQCPTDPCSGVPDDDIVECLTSSFGFAYARCCGGLGILKPAVALGAEICDKSIGADKGRPDIFVSQDAKQISSADGSMSASPRAIGAIVAARPSGSGRCREVPCRGISDGGIVECLISSFERVYARCCGEDGLLGSKEAAIAKTCDEATKTYEATNRKNSNRVEAQESEEASKTSNIGRIRRVQNTLMQCPEVPCNGIPDGDIAECLNSSFEVEYALCCGEQGSLGSKDAALAKTCNEVTEAEDANIHIFLHPSQTPESSDESKTIDFGQIRRVQNDLMQCPEAPCSGIPDGDLVECLNFAYEVVYARCCGEEGLLGSKDAAVAEICGKATKAYEATNQNDSNRVEVHEGEGAAKTSNMGKIRRVQNDLMQCPEVPCIGIPDGDIAECLDSSFELEYALCCGEQGSLGSKDAALAKSCIGAAEAEDAIIHRNTSEVEEASETSKFNLFSQARRAHNDLKQCPTVPCNGIPDGDIVECLSSTFQHMYVRCCGEEGLLGSKEVAVANACGGAAEVDEVNAQSPRDRMNVHARMKASKIERFRQSRRDHRRRRTILLYRRRRRRRNYDTQQRYNELTDLLQCPQVPCTGISDGGIVECLDSSSQLVYARCCGEKGLLGSKDSAVANTCGKTTGASNASSQSQRNQTKLHESRSAPNTNFSLNSIRRVHNDLMQCPEVPCSGLPDGSLVECLNSSFELVYARCCGEEGLLDSKDAAAAKKCGEATKLKEGNS